MISNNSSSLAQRLISIILVIILFFASIIQFLASRRGFDFTDESYYLLNYIYFNDIEALISLFGAYFYLPFLLVGESIWGIRVVGIALLLITTAFFAHFLWSSAARLWRILLPVKTPFYLAIMMAGFGFYSAHFATLITPGYNLLSLITMLITTAIVLDALGRESKRKGDSMRAFAYGLVMSICFFNKFSTALALFVVHTVLISNVTGGIHINTTSVRKWIWYSIAGFAVNALALWVAIPDLPIVLIRGFTYFTILIPRDIFSELYTIIVQDIPDVILLSISGGFWIGLAGFALALTSIASRRRTLLEIGVIIMIAFLLFDGVYRWMPQARLARNFEILLGLLAVYYGYMRQQGQRIDISPRLLTFLWLLMILPLVYSFGTNVIFFFHTAMAIIFPLSALLIVFAWLYNKNVIHINALLIGVVCISLSTTENLVRPWLSALGTYRLGNPLTQENIPINLGPEFLGISTDQRTVTALSQFIDLLSRNEFQQGTPMIDFTGDSSGLISIAKAKPIGSLWIQSNTPTADAATRYLLSFIKSEDLRGAWLLTSTDHYRRIDQWQNMLKEQAPESNWVAVGSVVFPQAQWKQLDDPKPATITVWRPAE